MDAFPNADVLPASRIAFARTARIATPTPVEFATAGARGLMVVINVTAITASPSVVFTIQGVTYPDETVSGRGTAVTWDILPSAAIVGVGTTVLQVHPALGDTPNLLAEDCVPDKVRITAVHGDADSITYAVTAILVP